MIERKQISAGGVAFRGKFTETEVALILTQKEHLWQLPKGHIDEGETAEEAALREVKEEAGIECELLAPVGSIEYTFVDKYKSEPVHIHKTVHFFLMRFLTGNIADHDHEVLEVRWVNTHEAEKHLFHQAEKEILGKALLLINEFPAD